MQESTLKPIPAIPDFAVEYPAQPRLNLGLRPALLLLLVTVLVGIFLLSLSWGSVDIPLSEIVKVLTGGEASKQSWTNIVLKFRLPKAITAALAGAALGVSGLQMQTFFRNPLADSFVLGISSGASLGVALVILSAGTVTGTMLAAITVTSHFTLAIAASLGSGLVLLLVLGVAHRVESTMTLLILGLMFGYLASAIVSLLLYFSIPEQIQAFINWTFGSFSGTTWSQIRVFAPITLFGLVLSLGLSKSLNALLLGEAYARSMGLNLTTARFGIVFSTAILSGTVTAFCGPIAFIGIAVPHICRSLFGTSDHRVLVPASMLVGAIVALTAALIAEFPGSRLVLPLNAVTSFIGAPIVIWVILRQRNLDKAFSE
jgi:iron complex transport system permease protein